MDWLVLIAIFLTSCRLILTVNDLPEGKKKETLKSIAEQIISTRGQKKYSETISQAYNDFSDYVFEGSQNESQYLDKMVEILYVLEDCHISKYP